MDYLLVFISVLGIVGAVNETPENKLVFDKDLYESVLDPELCVQQLSYMIENDNVLLGQFLDAGIRTPRGIFIGNLVDLGNYHQCLEINQVAEESTIEGKYCTVNVPINQNLEFPNLWPEIELPEIIWPEFPNISAFSDETLIKLNKYQELKRKTLVRDTTVTEELSFTLAVCLPKSCSTKQFFDGLFVNATAFGFSYEEGYCRLPNDKRWVPGDYVAIVIFSILIVLAIASTLYEVYQARILDRDPKSLNKIFVSFSVLTNTRRLVTYTPVPGAIECIDGIRALAMMWVVIGHTYVTQLSYLMANPGDVLAFITSPEGIWVTVGPITVDTFFMISGLLLVFTCTGKFTGMKLLKSLHFFYLNRLLRMFPVLAAFVLLQASLLSRMFDGPHWYLVEKATENCRTNWWATLLHVQNWVNRGNMCLPHSWYLAIDVQLYIISPIVLLFVFVKRKYIPWIGLCGALIISLTFSTVYNFKYNFAPGPVIPSRPLDEQTYFLYHYYINTLTRSSPFFIGMIFGYVMHLYKGQKMVISKISATILWICSAIIIAVICYLTYNIMQLDWENQTVDNLINSYMRPAWAMAIGWMVLACSQGYGGPINWVLSLECWKVISRLSYAIYIVHYPLIHLVNSTALAPTHFSITGSLFKFIADFGLATLVAYILTLLVDAPCSAFIKLALGGAGPRRPPPMKQESIKNDLEGISNRGLEDTDIKIRL